MKNKKAQEEMVGFAVIIVFVAIIILAFVALSVYNKDSGENIESYEVNSFIQSVLQSTTGCEEWSGFVSVKELIFKCEFNEDCSGGEDPCDMLNETLSNILENSWIVGNDTSIKGYKLEVFADGTEIVKLMKGIETNNYKGNMQSFIKSGKDFEFYFNSYY